MPVAYLMSWEPKNRRWWKMEKGRRYVVSVRQLRKHFDDETIPDTKEGSYTFANRWWRERAGAPVGVEPTRWMEAHDWDTGEPTGVCMEVSQSEIDYRLARREELRQGLRALLDTRGTTSAERTVSAQVDRYLDLQLTRHRAGQISVCTYDNLRHDLNAFRDWLGPATAIDAITADCWEGWWRHLMTSTLPIDTRRKRLRGARAWVSWLVSRGALPPVTNLDSRLYRFKSEPVAIRTLEVDKVKPLVEGADGVMRLLLLLMLNCGFTQQDCSDLHPSEVDWTEGRIRRKRSKTGDNPHVPVVDYLLWGETWQLLQEHGRRDGDHALLTQGGKTWVRDSIKPDGKRHRVDAVQSLWRHYPGS